MATKAAKILVLLMLLLLTLGCVIPIVGETGQNLINNLVDWGDEATRTLQPTLLIPTDNSNKNNEIADTAGIYKGISTISDIWVNSFGGKVYLNNFEISIDKKGKITGTLESYWETEDSEPMKWEPNPGDSPHYCVTRMSNLDQGTITGSLMEPDGSRQYIYGLIELNMFAKKQIFRIDCPADFEENLGYYKIYADIYIDGNHLTGKVSNDIGGTSLTIDAIKQ
ncbi:MAG: hypothetical protein CVU42_17600 [Chloroflexi bacterium HGW-Chloroflexi-4]|jgi:hypothetical protein|nr:MAG: hypothetical protein CVU45_01590 [Chloroflexi bacterium HGW-Chloroflexi-7]PKN97006.1 MAG: hypothetical protein CVU42_17600 [Chloroflexi bacterium HGW-Chloroflexi-4]